MFIPESRVSDTKYCHLAIHYVLPNLLPGPNLQFRFMKNSVHTSLLGSLMTVLQDFSENIFFVMNLNFKLFIFCLYCKIL